eukprot:TRINITY_DN14791_c0_g1_i16.p1 TRINITY_DN14791_c0_g1~~TRINITY_DN14791_c0_g1_i16.p1  ORF type:complete len:313 (-),score=74.09 TRINITY_DN14791_c0_g1_i16:1064-2002(-)
MNGICSDLVASLKMENTCQPHWTDIVSRRDPSKLPFKELREMWGVSNEDIIASFSQDNVVGAYSEGKSRGLLIMSKDLKYVIKSLPVAEYAYLYEFLPKYFDYVRKQPNTLLVKFFATFLSGQSHYLLMTNIFASANGSMPKEKYDLKGAVSKRHTLHELRMSETTLKDGDWIEDKRKIYVPRDLLSPLLDQIQSDVSFLASLHVMDYSLLVGINYDTDNNPNPNTNTNPKHLRQSVATPVSFPSFNSERKRSEFIYLGIIDMLMYYDVGRSLFSSWRQLSENKEQISTVDPTFYAQRFHTWVKEFVFFEQK